MSTSTRTHNRASRLTSWAKPSLGWGLLALACANSPSTEVSETGGTPPMVLNGTGGSGTGGSAPSTPSSNPVGGGTGGQSTAEAPVQAAPILDVSTTPFVFDSRWPDCIHPGVEAQCSDGWCRVNAGCYIYGSPEGELGRAAFGEEQGPITQTYELEAMQYELTWAEWDRMGWPRQANERTCDEDTCPAAMTWIEAVSYANALSASHEPPLQPCYELAGACVGAPGQGLSCGGVRSVLPVNSCTGYRLPTIYEWQYLARAGTPTAFYSGPLMVEQAEQYSCSPNAIVEGIAWYCGNTGAEGRMRPVGTKLANQWGFFDVIGNASEWMNDGSRQAPDYPAVDPALDTSLAATKLVAGGISYGWPTSMRVSTYLPGFSASVRLVRTLEPGTLPQL